MHRLHPGQASHVGQVPRAEIQHAVKVASRYDQSSVHIELAERQRWIDHQSPFGPAIHDLHAKERTLAVAKRFSDAVGALPPRGGPCEPAAANMP